MSNLSKARGLILHRYRFPRLGFASFAVLAAVIVLIVLPLVLNERYIGTLIKMLAASLFALAFNILWRQTKLLSFGHAAYFGVGMFAVVHLMRAIEAGSFSLPLPLVPFAGLGVGLAFGWIAGFFSTIRTGTYFAMVTLAIAELIHQLAPQWEGVFGGEAGLSSMRMPWAGITFGSDVEVYYLVLAWFVLAVAAMYLFTLTPLGRLAFALGDNELRVRFLGYGTHAMKTRVFAVSGMFAGLAGGLLALANENVDHTIFNAFVSGSAVIHTFVGGAGIFFGPVIGAAGLTVFGFVVSDATRLWILYQGIIFVLVVMYAPQGIGGLIGDHVEPWRQGKLRGLAGPYFIALLAASSLTGGTVFLFEYLARLFSDPYGIQAATTKGLPVVEFFGTAWPHTSPVTWIVPLALFAAGILLLRLAIKRSRTAWAQIKTSGAGAAQ
jgi:branched-chain amino acid transport system permease protein